MITAWLLACNALFNCPVTVPAGDFKTIAACRKAVPSLFHEWDDLSTVVNGEKMYLRIICSENQPELLAPGKDI